MTSSGELVIYYIRHVPADTLILFCFFSEKVLFFINENSEFLSWLSMKFLSLLSWIVRDTQSLSSHSAVYRFQLKKTFDNRATTQKLEDI